MSAENTLEINGPAGPTTVLFTEASPSQRISSYRLSAAGFGPPLSEDDFIARETYLSQHPLTKGSKWRFWCVVLASDPEQVVVTARTVHRDLLIADAAGMKEEQGHCISSVITDARYRKQGLASFMLENVARWLDGEGNATASLLYCSITEFYISRGWHPVPAFQSQLKTSSVQDLDRSELPRTKVLGKTDIPELCAHDVNLIKAEFAKLEPKEEDIYLAVLPTEDLITWLQERAEFVSLKTNNGKIPTAKGSLCETTNAWVYWHHDFRRNQLYIQRAREPAEDTPAGNKALASLLLDACDEARKWKFPVVSAWNATPALLRAMQFLANTFSVEVKTEERINNDTTSLRWKGADRGKNVQVCFNEAYAFN